MDDIQIPNRNGRTNEQEIKRKLESCMQDFKNLLADKTHPDNQTAAIKKNITSVVNRLLVAADEMDSIKPAEGTFGLIVLTMLSLLKLKDENVKLEVEVKALQRELSKIKK
jgi:hypothetical protein